MILLRDIRYVRLGTRDLDASARFARDILGLEPAGCAQRRVESYISFKDPSGNQIELVVRPHSGKEYFRQRAAGITGFSHSTKCTTAWRCSPRPTPVCST